MIKKTNSQNIFKKISYPVNLSINAWYLGVNLSFLIIDFEVKSLSLFL
jgi:hypothetical protein